MSDKTELTRYTAPPGGGLFEDADGPLVWGEDADTLIASLKEQIEAQRELMREAATCVFEVCPDLYDRLRKATKAGGE